MKKQKSILFVKLEKQKGIEIVYYFTGMASFDGVISSCFPNCSPLKSDAMIFDIKDPYFVVIKKCLMKFYKQCFVEKF